MHNESKKVILLNSDPVLIKQATFLLLEKGRDLGGEQIKLPVNPNPSLLFFLHRDLVQLPRQEGRDISATSLLGQWASYGLQDVQLVNYSVLLDLPASSPNTVTLKSTGECFYPTGQLCNKETPNRHNQELLYAYAAYSAKGTLEVMQPLVSVILVRRKRKKKCLTSH